jgi:hypothetical protein
MPLFGTAAMLLSFDVVPHAIPKHDDWHTHEHLPERLSTKEQGIRGADASVDWAVLAIGYGDESVAGLLEADLCNAQLEQHGATGVLSAMYRMEYSLTARELDCRDPKR